MVYRALEANIAAHLFHQSLGDNQPEPGAAMAAGNACICLPKCLKQLCLLSLGDANTGISDLNFQLQLFMALTVAFNADIDIALSMNLMALAQQISDHLLQTHRIADKTFGYAGLNVERQL